MDHRMTSPRAVAALAAAVALLGLATTASAAQVVFDLPESIECRDVTPPGFAAADYLKVIEGKMRITARIVQGSEDEIVDFVYVITSPDKRVRFQDYLPNTTLESAFADDQVEIKDTTETSTSGTVDAHVVYKLLALGGSLNQNSKDSEASHYRKIAPKELVIASGTIEREHGVYFRLRPSRARSLEGAKEFSFLATVPKDWRGDLCAISCTARSRKDSFWSESVVTAGTRSADIGMYLAGDLEAASLAEDLRRAQDMHAEMLAALPPKPNVVESAIRTIGLSSKKPGNQQRQALDEAEQALADVRLRLKQLGR